MKITFTPTNSIKSEREKLKKKYFPFNVFFGVAIIYGTASSILWPDSNLTILTVKLAFFSFCGVLLLISKIYMQASSNFIKSFADENNFTYLAKHMAPVNKARYLSVAPYEIKDYVTGIFTGYPFGLYTYLSKVDGNAPALFNVLEINFPAKVSNLLLISSATNTFVGLVTDLSKRMQKVQLEGNFNDTYTLFIEPGTQVSALQILTPDVMEVLIANKFPYNIEICDDSLYIYTTESRILDTSEDLKEIFSVAEFLISYMVPILEKVKS